MQKKNITALEIGARDNKSQDDIRQIGIAKIEKRNLCRNYEKSKSVNLYQPLCSAGRITCTAGQHSSSECNSG